MKTYIPILLFLVKTCVAQQFLELPNFDFSDLDYSKTSLTLYDSYKIYNIDLKTLAIEEKDIKFFDAKKNYFIQKINDKKFFFQNGTGKVFIEKENQIERVDNSVLENYLIGSNFFVSNDTVYRHGGYGYWSLFDKLIYFDTNTFQWELSKNDFIGRIDQFSLTSNDIIYFFGGHSLSKSIPQFDIEDIFFYSFNPNLNKLDTLGKTNISFRGSKILKNDLNKNLIINNERKILELNFKENQVYEYYSNSLNTKISNNKNSYIHDKKFYFFTNINGKDILNIYPQDLFISNAISKNPIFIKNTRILIYLILISFVFLIFYILFRRYKNIYLTPSEIKYKLKKVKITHVEFLVLSKIIEKSEAQSIEIDQIIFDKNLSRASNYKRKQNVIDGINNKLNKLTGTNNILLLNKKSELDSRIKVFYIDQQFILKGN